MSKFIMFDAMNVEVRGSVELTKAEKRKLRRAIREMPYNIFNFLEAVGYPKELRNKVKIKIT